VAGSSTSWYVLVRKGAGTDLCESKESRMPSQLSRRRAIGRGEKERVVWCAYESENENGEGKGKDR